jgi:gas vesicle protein
LLIDKEKERNMERESHGRSHVSWIIGAAALGAAAMYLLDPDHGRRRRAVAKDKVYSAKRKTQKAAERTARHLTNRARGIIAQTKKSLPETQDLMDTQKTDTQTLSSAQNLTGTQSAGYES